MGKKSSLFFVNGLLLLSVVSWGFSFVSMKTILAAGVPPMTMATIRYCIVSVIFGIAFLIPKKDRNSSLSWKNHLLLLLSGVAGITFYFWFEARGLVYTTASNASIIIALVPIVTVGIDVLFCKNRITGWQGLGIFVSFIGAYLLVAHPGMMQNSTPFPLVKGNILMIGAVFCWVIFTLLGRTLQNRVDTFRTTAWQSFYGTLFLLPFVWAEKEFWIPIPPSLWLSFLYLAVMCSVLAYYFYNIAIKKLGVTVVSAYVNFVPLVGVLGGVFVLQEKMNLMQWMGGCLIVASLCLVHVRGKKKIAN